jgi:hypothetical protein
MTVPELNEAIELAEINSTRLYDRYTKLQSRLYRGYKHGAQSANRAYKEYVKAADRLADLRRELAILTKETQDDQSTCKA